MGADGIAEASDLSVLANNYMDKRLLEIPGLTKSHPHLDGYRMEMTRYGLGKLQEETGVGVVDVENRMTDYGIDVLAQVVREAYEEPELVRTSPHNQVVHRTADVDLDDPDVWATTWRAYLRKRSGGAPPP